VFSVQTQLNNKKINDPISLGHRDGFFLAQFNIISSESILSQPFTDLKVPVLLWPLIELPANTNLMISNKNSHTGNSSPYKNIKKRGLAAINEDNSPSKHPRQMDSDSRPTNGPRAELETAKMDALLNIFFNSVNKENVNVDDGNKNITDEKTSPAITKTDRNKDILSSRIHQSTKS
jgi:hypothetical protein